MQLQEVKPSGNEKQVAIRALKIIAEMKPEKDEWDGADLYGKAVKVAQDALSELGVKFSNHME